MKAHVLIVDDDELVRTGLMSSLEELGWRVSAAGDVAGALAQMAQDPADIVLVDLVLGNEDGMVLLRRLRETHPDTPVMMFTGHGTAVSAVESLRQGAADYLVKPIRPEEIAQRLDTVLTTYRLRRRLEADRERARLEAETREARWLRAARFETAMTLLRGLARELTPLTQAIQLDQLAPDQRAPVATALQRLNQLSTLAAPGPTPELEMADLNGPLRAALEMPNIRAARDARADLMIEIKMAAAPIWIRANPPLLRAALSSLIAELIRACPAGGRVLVETLREEYQEPWGHFVRGASGPYGVVHLFTSAVITAEEMDHLFEPYAAQHLVADGLALPIALTCMRQHHGLTVVRPSLSPPGTDLRLLFPVQAAPDSKAHEPACARRGGLRVLVVDDSPAHRSMIVALVRELGCHADEASDSASSLQRFAEALDRGEPYDAAIVDLILGEPMDGVDLAREMLARQPSLAVILASGFADLARVEEGRGVGVLEHLVKPLERDALARALGRVAAQPPPQQTGVSG